MLDKIDIRTLKGLFSYVRPYRYWVALILFLVLFMVALELGVAWMIKEMTDHGIQGNEGEVIRFFFLGLGLFLLTGVNNFAKTYLTGKVAEETIRDLKSSIYEHIQELPIRFYEEGRSGNLLSHFSNDMNMLFQAMKFHFIPLLENPLMALFSFIFLFFINWRLAFICLATGPLTYFVGRYFSRPIMSESRRVQEILGESNAFLTDSIQGIHIVKAFGLEQEFSTRYSQYCSTIYAGNMKRTLYESSLHGISFFVGSLSFMLTFGFGILFILYNQLTVGELWAFVQLINRVIWPFSGLASIWGGFTASVAAGGRIFQLFQEPQERRGLSRSRKPALGQIVCQDVHFAYDKKHSVFTGLNFSTVPGQVVAFVGSSGAGKSTLFKLLMGFYTPDKGGIYFDGQELKEMGVEEIRASCSFVSQDVYLFHGTIYQNIGYGRPGASKEEIQEAAQKANAHQFIQGLPKGYETMVGERGVKLSGGERQRLSIARALLKDAKILLLDEPTSSLDAESEELVKGALERLIEGRTTLVIAHRLSTVRTAHRIMLIHQGRIEATGSHNHLLEKSLTYRNLFKIKLRKEEGVG